LTPQIAEVDAERRRVERARNGNSFDSATLLMTREERVEQNAGTPNLALDDPASFARPLRVRNLFVEVWLLAVLAAPSLWLVRTAQHGSTARPPQGMTRVDEQVFFFSRTLSSLPSVSEPSLGSDTDQTGVLALPSAALKKSDEDGS
jgi:hypothetical protein